MIRTIAVWLVCLCILPLFSACEGGSVSDSRQVEDGLSSKTTQAGSLPSSDPVTEVETSSSVPVPQTPVQTMDPQSVLEASEHLVGLTDQLNQRIIVCDLAVEDWSNDNAVVWECDTYAGVAGIKLRNSEYWGGPVVVICSGTRASIISYDTKKVLLDTNNAARNAHSVELLPSGALIVASSTGNEVRIFGPGKTDYSDAVTLTSAHGALWDPKYNVLWLSGDNVLAAYRVTGSPESPQLTPVDGMRYHIRTGLHDLSPVYGNPDALYLTSGDGIVMFDKITGAVSYNYEGGSFGKTQTYVPGVGNFGQDNVMVFTTVRSDTLTYKEWGTDRVGIFVPLGKNAGRVLYRKASKDAYYKVRVWCSDYQ